MKYLFILNDSPYCSQHTYNALRLVRVLATGNTDVAIFLLGTALSVAYGGNRHLTLLTMCRRC